MMPRCQNCPDYNDCLAPKHCESYDDLTKATAWQIAKDKGYINWTHGFREAIEFMEEREMERQLERML
jgi:hypothetical protein